MQQCRVTHPEQAACFDGCLREHGFYDVHAPQDEVQIAWHCCQLSFIAGSLCAVLCKKIGCAGLFNWRQKLSDFAAWQMSEIRNQRSNLPSTASMQTHREEEPLDMNSLLGRKKD
jgi:hypothetical protein